MELIIDNVSKQYKDKMAVNHISIKLQAGVYGLLGENGAGKTTLMRMLCGILKPSSGTITFDGVDVSEEEYRSILGYLPQDFGYYPEFTASDFLLYFAALKGIPKVQAKRRVNELLSLVSLEDIGKKRIKNFSGGMKQRLGIAQALLNNPKLIILDEPAAGMNPQETAELTELIRFIKDKFNISVILIEHDMSLVMNLCERIYVLDYGKLIANGNPEEIANNKFVIEAYLGEEV